MPVPQRTPAYTGDTWSQPLQIKVMEAHAQRWCIPVNPGILEVEAVKPGVHSQPLLYGGFEASLSYMSSCHKIRCKKKKK